MMKSEVRIKPIALQIEIKENGKENVFHFTNKMLGEIYKGLLLSYQEVFIWTFKNYVSVWSVGIDRLSLINAFIRHHNQFEKMKVIEEGAAIDHFQDIIASVCWEDCSLPEKAASLVNSYALADAESSLGITLKPMITDCLAALGNNSIIAGARNSWNKPYQEIPADADERNQLQESSQDLFYRFSIN